MIVIAADIEYQHRSEALKYGFTYNSDIHRYIKRLKEADYSEFIKTLPFKVTVLKG